MRILMVHNYYQQRGGEDECTDQEIQLLRDRGHQVQLYARHNDEVKAWPLHRRAEMFMGTSWSARTVREIGNQVETFQPDVVHVQNFFPLITPSVFHATRGVPTVSTLHNYRLMCPTGTYFRNGNVCEKCRLHGLGSGIRHRCYRGSAVQTAAVALMLRRHRRMRTWDRQVSAWVALTPFARDKFVEAGLPADRILVRPNFLYHDIEPGGDERSGAVFVGRLSEEKGLAFLLDAWRQLPDIQLRIIGEGPQRAALETMIERKGLTNVHLAGRMPLEDVLEQIRCAACLVMPSRWYETFGRTIIEAYAAGTPVVAPRHGAMADLVDHGKTGWLYDYDDTPGLVESVQNILRDPVAAREVGRRAREVFEEQYSRDAGYESLVAVYRHVAGV